MEEIDFLAENLTAEEQRMKAMGMTYSDLNKPNIATGGLGIALLTLTVLTIITLDMIGVKQNCAILKRNLQEVLRR